MAAAAVSSDEARADRRVVLTALAVMLGLILSGVVLASLIATTSCRQLRPEASTAPLAAADGPSARALLVGAGATEEALLAAETLLGPAISAVVTPLTRPMRIGPAPTGIGEVVVTGDGAALLSATGEVAAAATFRRDVTVVGDGIAVFALVVGNALTGQVDALRPLVVTREGFEAGACVDTSAVGSPLAFLHDARDGQLVGLRTDEDGSEAVVELRDHVRGRVWAPAMDLPRAPAGLQGSRTSGAIGPTAVVVARRIVRDAAEPMPAVLALSRVDGQVRWSLDGETVRAALPADLAAEPALRIAVAHVGADVVHLAVHPDVPADALLPLPTFGPLGALAPADPRTVTLVVDMADGARSMTLPGASPVGRDGTERGRARAALAAVGFAVDDVLVTPQGTWLLVGDVVARFGG